MPFAMGHAAAASLVAGVGLFVIPPFGQMPFAYQAVFAWLLLALWSYSDGWFGRFNAALALLEGAVLLRFSIELVYFLVEAFG
jgi:hypothetical protein